MHYYPRQLLTFSSRMTGCTPKKGRDALPGFSSHTRVCSGVIMWPPVSVCHQLHRKIEGKAPSLGIAIVCGVGRELVSDITTGAHSLHDPLVCTLHQAESEQHKGTGTPT